MSARNTTLARCGLNKGAHSSCNEEKSSHPLITTFLNAFRRLRRHGSGRAHTACTDHLHRNLSKMCLSAAVVRCYSYDRYAFGMINAEGLIFDLFPPSVPAMTSILHAWNTSPPCITFCHANGCSFPVRQLDPHSHDCFENLSPFSFSVNWHSYSPFDSNF